MIAPGAAEHALRYAAAAPVVRGGQAWADLGCGDGRAAREGLGAPPYAGRVVLVDRDALALRDAERALGAEGGAPQVDRAADAPALRDAERALGAEGGAPQAAPTALRVDLADASQVRELHAALRGLEDLTVTCLGVIQALPTFVPLVDLLVALAQDEGATVVLSVPDQAVAPSRTDSRGPLLWSEGAFEELRRLLPADARVARQVPLAGAAVVPDGASAPLPLDPVEVPADLAPVHLLAAFGPRADALAAVARAVPADLVAQRRRELALAADLARLEARVAELEGR